MDHWAFDVPPEEELVPDWKRKTLPSRFQPAQLTKRPVSVPAETRGTPAAGPSAHLQLEMASPSAVSGKATEPALSEEEVLPDWKRRKASSTVSSVSPQKIGAAKAAVPLAVILGLEPPASTQAIDKEQKTESSSLPLADSSVLEASAPTVEAPSQTEQGADDLIPDWKRKTKRPEAVLASQEAAKRSVSVLPDSAKEANSSSLCLGVEAEKSGTATTAEQISTVSAPAKPADVDKPALSVAEAPTPPESDDQPLIPDWKRKCATNMRPTRAVASAVPAAAAGETARSTSPVPLAVVLGLGQPSPDQSELLPEQAKQGSPSAPEERGAESIPDWKLGLRLLVGSQLPASTAPVAAESAAEGQEEDLIPDWKRRSDRKASQAVAPRREAPKMGGVFPDVAPDNLLQDESHDKDDHELADDDLQQALFRAIDL
eukprot:TRINITY_DN18161_c0_g1_i2.p1 TRINITY_DN18161_c0_g1~~TRINITY_DN18161_c0_g1_i2.p1  ORF type:complete len:431 (+),score=98.37 TRINITY_DN18161_c0_g1_i2:31-1323(+)